MIDGPNKNSNACRLNDCPNSSGTPSTIPRSKHATARVPLSGDIGLYEMHRLSAVEPLESLVATLNALRPDVMVVYSSVAALLADEQLQGRLEIRPRVVAATAEICTDEMDQGIEAAWGVKPCHLYAMTEAIHFGSDCAHHRGVHVFEHLVLLEVVDEPNRPVADGVPGRKILITNLYNHTQPLIRYEVSDMITIDPQPCPCRRPFRLISRIEGRSDDILRLEGIRSDSVSVHPITFRSLLGEIERLKEYQVVYENQGLYLNLVLRGVADEKAFAHELGDRVRRKLASVGARCPAIHVHFTERIPRDPGQLGKLKLVKICN
jgi:phenylacetate-coenzyme A ligase PaaK-like adenylate-forming protein